MQQICKREQCTGCGACANACIHHAIDLKPDKCGYLYPVINNNICRDCGLCQRICPVNNPPEYQAIEKCFAGTLKSDNELLSCSSGGVATAISRYFISIGGVVYGCSASNILHVQHIRVDIMEDIEKLKGSKYVHSDIGNTYIHVKEDLRRGKKVLFVGTPCQVAGLYSFLRTKYDNLYTIDLVCHGVPSQKMLNDNISSNSVDNDVITFRIKQKVKNETRIVFGLNRYNTMTGNSIFKPYHRDFYMFGFLRCLTFRVNCYFCSYAQNKRVGDITLCDFWGLSETAGFELGKGVSAILVTNKKGLKVVESVKDNLFIKEREIIEAMRWNNQLNNPSRKPKRYTIFIKLYEKCSFRQAMIIAYLIDYIYDRYIDKKNKLKLFLIKHNLLHHK